jgi:cellulose synthase/poly-beta-1,6-N-acetylglucosamine synthase-like glycosyltransferase
MPEILETVESSFHSTRQENNNTGVKRFNKLSIIIPAFNEEKTITQVLDKIRLVHLIQRIQKEAIIIDDCSTDNTARVIANYIRTYP